MAENIIRVEFVKNVVDFSSFSDDDMRHFADHLKSTSVHYYIEGKKEIGDAFVREMTSIFNYLDKRSKLAQEKSKASQFQKQKK